MVVSHSYKNNNSVGGKMKEEEFINNFYFKQLKRLQKENEELKERQITKNGFICDCEQNAKYKQALEEIRELIQKCEIEDISCVQCKERKRCHCDLTRLLIEKIDGALNDRN